MTTVDVGEQERQRRLIRPEGHQFTAAEVAAMTGEELELNWSAIQPQAERIGAERNAGLRNPKSVS